MKHLKVILSLFIVFIMFSGSWWGDDKKKSRIIINQEKFIAKQAIIRTNNETLELLYKYVPKAKSELLKSYGYATFTNIGATILIISYENGQGMAHSNRNGINTYMKMQSGGLGLGLGGKDFKTVFLFENKEAYNNFINSGWEANAQADAAAKYNETGGASNAAITVAKGVKLYKFTQDGLLIQATIMGTKYYKDEELNRY